jgi:hypothetical protein
MLWREIQILVAGDKLLKDGWLFANFWFRSLIMVL